MQVATFLAYLLAAALFIVGIRRLRKPETARSGNTIAGLGMAIALITTLFVIEFRSLVLIGIAIALGSVFGALSAQRVPMTAMPQMVAAYNGVGGGAAALIALSEFYHLQNEGSENLVATITVPLTILIGTVSFMGSIVAFLKLQELAFSGSVKFPLQQVVNALLFIGILILAANAISDGSLLPFLSPVASVIALLAAAAILGVLLVIPIGGADMPIVISLLNAATGLAAAASGFVLENYILIIGGTIVGASGTILTRQMSGALGRPLRKIIFAGIAATGTGSKQGGGDDDREVNDSSAEAAGSYLAEEAQKIVIVPGYGLAVAQAQSPMHDLMETLESQGKEVLFGIHPVAGRMPGHMNVLLTEAGVPYDKLYDLEDINPEFEDTDAVIIVGANDVVNPAANDPEQDTPISGMPILDVEKAEKVIFVKRSLSPGFAGVDNPLFYDTEKTMMVFSDAKAGLQQINEAAKNS